MYVVGGCHQHLAARFHEVEGDRAVRGGKAEQPSGAGQGERGGGGGGGVGQHAIAKVRTPMTAMRERGRSSLFQIF